MTHTEKFHSKPYRTDVSYMSSLGPRRGSENQAPIPPIPHPKKTAGLFIVILTALLFSCRKRGEKQKHRLSWCVSRFPPLRSPVQFSPHWAAQEQQASNSFVEQIRAFLSLLARCLLLQTGYNYPAVPKHTNLIEQTNRCCTVLPYSKKPKKCLY